MSTTESSEAAANFIKTYTHDKFIHPTKKTYPAETEVPYGSPNYDIHLSDKILPIIGQLQFNYVKKGAASWKSSNSSLNFPESISEVGEGEEEPEWQDSSYEASDEVDDSGDTVPELVRPMYQPELSTSPKKGFMADIDDKAQAYLKGRGQRRRASAPVALMVDIKEQDERASPVPSVPTVSKDEDDVPETPLSVIESLKHEAVILSQVKLRQMKRLDYRRGSMPAVQLAPVSKAGKPIGNERIHQIMQTFYGPKTKKQQQHIKHVGVLDPAEKASEIQIHPERKIHAGSPPRQSVAPPGPASIPVPPPLPEILQSAQQQPPEPIPVVVLEPAKPKLTEVVASLNPTVNVPAVDFGEMPTGNVVRRSSATQDLEDTFKKMDRNSLELSDSGSFSQSNEAGSSSWFGGLIGLRPAPAPRKPGETKPMNVKKKVKKRDMNVFAPAGF